MSFRLPWYRFWLPMIEGEEERGEERGGEREGRGGEGREVEKEMNGHSSY